MAPPGSRTLPTGSPTNEKLAECALVWDSTIQRMRGGDRGVARSLACTCMQVQVSLADASRGCQGPSFHFGFHPIGGRGYYVRGGPMPPWPPRRTLMATSASGASSPSHCGRCPNHVGCEGGRNAEGTPGCR